ncbi:uncharacterized protein BXZ73DRAFT_108389 [Epithele typhae]|uniref:uncharacterized protein n=1 Tax=Epithele typhae TaxID=378194 RepID=UPI002008E033|nr:uncharacterized protein BXZ73DRAFT_108389 [Epithele typhae]KAH9910900.1 hypothetical protein BXZ73DRAFT_108389 [Epithele typhae]
MAVSHLNASNFVNPNTNYFAAPQTFDAKGDTTGHSHIVIEPIPSLDSTNPTNSYIYFKGLNAAAVDGVLAAEVAGGLPKGKYRLASINTAAKPPAGADRGRAARSLDDMVYTKFLDTLRGDFTEVPDSAYNQLIRLNKLLRPKAERSADIKRGHVLGSSTKLEIMPPGRPSSGKSSAAQVKGRNAGEQLATRLKPALFSTHGDVDRALSDASKIFQDQTSDLLATLQSLEDNGAQGVLEFLLSACSTNDFDQLSDVLLRPPSFDVTFTGSIPFKMMERLAVTPPNDTPADPFETYRTTARVTMLVINTIALLLASGTLPDEDAATPQTRRAEKAQQKQNQKRRRSIHTGRGAGVDIQHILAYGAEVPTSKFQANVLLASVISEQMETLEAERAGGDRLKIITQKIDELREGHFTPDNHKMITKNAENIPIYEAKMDRNSRLVAEEQVINVYGVYNHVQINRMPWNQLSRQLFLNNGGVLPAIDAQTNEAITLCIQRCSKLQKFHNQLVETAPISEDLTKEQAEELQDLLTHAKFVAYSREYLASIYAQLSSKDAAFVFNLEKTTVIVFKMLSMDLASHETDEILVKHVKEYYNKLLRSIEVGRMSEEEVQKLASQRERERSEGLFNLDDEVEWVQNAPQRFNALQDNHFPLFLSYASTLWESVLVTRPRRAAGSALPQFLDFDMFLHIFWNHFPEHLQRNLSAELVFSEIMAIIKGSDEAIRSDQGFLKELQGIYAVFELYRSRRKTMAGVWYFDAADRCLDAVGVPGSHLRNIFVDECQDNLLIDSHVLRHLAFRFSELKAMNYRFGKRIYGSLKNVELDPPMFHLTVNHRRTLGSFVARSQLGPRESTVDFGASQCILVRNDGVKTRLQAEVPDARHLITIYESKGLEFDDVIIWDFFNDSRVDESSWRIILNDVPGARAPASDVGRHAGVCRELKHLYVAMTRARKNLWIVDCSDRSNPIRELFLYENLVDIHDQHVPLSPTTRTSTKEEWEDQARTFFHHKIYAEAANDFVRAGLDREARVARAYLRRQEASRLPAFDISSRNVREHAYYEAAALCFVEGGAALSAAREYEAAEVYDDAATLYRQTGKFDDAVRLVKMGVVSAEVGEEILSISRLHYIKTKRTAKVLELSKTTQQRLWNTWTTVGSNASGAAFLVDLGRYHDAAERVLRDGDILGAIDLFLTNAENAASVSRAVEIVLDGLWERLPLTALDDNFRDPIVQSLLEHAEVLLPKLPRRSHPRDALRMFSAIYLYDFAVLDELCDVFLAQENTPEALLSLDYVFIGKFGELEAALERAKKDPKDAGDQEFLRRVTQALEDTGHEAIEKAFHSFLQYARILQRLSCNPNPCSDPILQTLFAFRPHSNEDHFQVMSRSRLYLACYRVCQYPQQGSVFVLSRFDLEKALKETLRDLLRSRVETQKEVAHTMYSLKPCLQSAAFGNGQCGRYDCPNYWHGSVPKASSEATTTYNRVIRIYVYEIMIFHTLFATDMPYNVREKQQRAWIRKLYEALFPPHANLGSLHLVSGALGKNLQREARRVIVVWIKDFLNVLHPVHPSKTFLANFMRAARLAMLFDRAGAARDLHLVPSSVRSGSWRPQELTEPNALERGVIYVQYVLDNQNFVDIGVLCEYLDHLSTELVEQAVLSPKAYGECVKKLLKLLYCGGEPAGRFMSETFYLSDNRFNPKMHRALYFRRVCINFLLWAYNSGPSYEVDANATMAHSKHSRLMDPTISPLIYALDWAERRNLALRSLDNCPTDEMIRLHHSSTPIQANSTGVKSGSIRNVYFSRHSDILHLLGITTPPWVSIDPHREQRAVEFTAAQHCAAFIIDRAYSSYLQRKSIDDSVRAMFIRFRLSAHKEACCGRCAYRHLYLGPVPQLLVAVDGLKDLLYHRKSAASAELDRSNDHRDLERLNKEMNEARTDFKAAMQLHKALAPNGAVHRNGDRAELLELVETARSLLERVRKILPQAGIDPRWSEYVALAMRCRRM